MNTLIVNRETFQMPTDGWYQLAPLGEFAHAAAGVVQVVDAEACTSMAARFKADAAVANFAGLLVDFDHFSLDGERRTEAAGWIVDVAARDTGLWANIRWSDVGEEAVKGGRYRFLSPVWARSDCVDLGPSTGSTGSPQTGSGQGMQRVRPVRLLNAAVTNDPNLKGMCPLCNNGQDHRPQTIDLRPDGAPVDSRTSYVGAHVDHGKDGLTMKRVMEKLVNHLGLPGDATEDAILEKMQGLPGLTAVTDLQNSLKQTQDERDALKADLQNSVKQAQADRDALQGKLKGAEDELVNRHLAEFEGVISDATKPFWTEQLLKNREGALAALGDVAKKRDEGGNLKPEGGEDSRQTATGKDGGQTGTRKPLHNRATVRPVIPGVATGAAQGGQAESKAVKIRNRAHEIAKGEGVAFSAAFRRAEKEICEE